jgi:hypothetical protein
MTEDLHPLKGQESRRAQRLLVATRLWIELLLVVSSLCRSDAFSLNTLSSSTKWKNLPAVKKLENGRNILKRSLPYSMKTLQFGIKTRKYALSFGLPIKTEFFHIGHFFRL